MLWPRSPLSTKACKPTSMHTFTNHICFTHFFNAKWKPSLLHKCEVTSCSSSGKVLMWNVWTELMWLTWTPQTCSDVIRSFLVITVHNYVYKYFMGVETWCQLYLLLCAMCCGHAVVIIRLFWMCGSRWLNFDLYLFMYSEICLVLKLFIFIVVL